MSIQKLSMDETVRVRLDAALSRLSHAYMITGASDAEAEKFAKYLAAVYVCSGQGEKPCGVCSGCRKAESGIHPDIIRVTVPEDKRFISVEQVRQLRAEAYIRPNEAARKVFIIKDAQAMNDSAQNALLKVLEDGPEYLAFLLLVEYPQQLLPTIRSRCETLSLISRSDGDGAELDAEQKTAADELARLLIQGEARALMEYTVGLENKKWGKDTLLAFLGAVEAALQPELEADPRRILPLIERVKQVRRAALFNVGTGHLLGWLAAGDQSR